MPPELASAHAVFRAQAERVEAARQALLSCLPVGRVHPAPVPVGLELLRDEVTAVLDDMEAWRVPQLEGQWQAAREAIRESLAAVADAHEVATSSTELEALLGAVGEVVEPLDAWADAERAWLALRVRPARTRAGRAP